MNTAAQQTPQRRITIIPADPQLTEKDIRKKHLRVAPYCRVSTDNEEQLNSYNAQPLSPSGEPPPDPSKRGT